MDQDQDQHLKMVTDILAGDNVCCLCSDVGTTLCRGLSGKWICEDCRKWIDSRGLEDLWVGEVER